MEVAALTTRVEVDVSKLGPSLDSLQKNIETLGKTMTALGANITNLTTTMEKAGASTTKLKKPTDDLGGSSGNLGRYMRELTTSMLGNNVAAVALGTTLGNMATQALTRLVIAIASSVTQFTRLESTLIEVDNIGVSASRALQQITIAAIGNNKGVADLTKEYAAFAQQMVGTRVSAEEALNIFIRHQEALKTLQQQSLASNFSGLMTEFGGVISGLDRLMSSSILVGGIINAAAAGLRYIKELLPKSDELQTFTAMQQRAQELTDQIKDMFASMKTMHQGARNDMYERINLLIKERDTLNTLMGAEVARAKTASEAKINNILRDTNAELSNSIANMRLSSQETEVANRMFAITNQLRQTGLTQLGAEVEAQRLLGEVRAQVFAQQYQGLRDSLMTVEGLEMLSFSRRTAMIQEFLNRGLISQREHDTLMQDEFYRSTYAMKQIEMQRNQILFNAFIQTAQYGEQLLQQLGQKSKAAAIAAIIVGKGIAIASTIQQGIVASTAALAPPPIGLGPVAGWGLSATIQALTVANVGLIAATGAMQIGGAISGGGGSSGSGGGGASASTPPSSTTTPPKNFGQTITIEGTDPAMVYTGKQLLALVDRINDAVKNGATMITTKTRGG